MISIGIDIGTTTICAIAAEVENGAVLKSITVPNDTFIPSDNKWERVQDCSRILEKATALIQTLSAMFDKIASIGVTGQMHGILYTDDNGNAASPLYTWQDGRGDLLSGDMTYAGRLSGITGYDCAAGYGMVTHYYNLINGIVPRNAVRLCTIHDYVAMRLCGLKTPLVHTSDAASLGIFELKGGRFDVEKLGAAEIGCEMLPEVTQDFSVIGEYKGIPVSAAIGDNQASFLGSVKGKDCLLVNVGTGSQVSMLADGWRAPASCEVRPLYSNCGIIVGSSLCGGRAYALLEQFFRSCTEIFAGSAGTGFYKKMDELALENLDADSVNVSTLFCGTRRDPGLRGSVTGIGTENFTPQSLTIGTLNGMAQELEQLYNDMSKFAVQKPAVLVGSGNGIRMNKPLRLILRKRFGMPLVMPVHNEEASFGALMFSLVACGIYPSVGAAQEAMIQYNEEKG